MKKMLLKTKKRSKDVKGKEIKSEGIEGIWVKEYYRASHQAEEEAVKLYSLSEKTLSYTIQDIKYFLISPSSSSLLSFWSLGFSLSDFCLVLALSFDDNTTDKNFDWYRIPPYFSLSQLVRFLPRPGFFLFQIVHISFISQWPLSVSNLSQSLFLNTVSPHSSTCDPSLSLLLSSSSSSSSPSSSSSSSSPSSFPSPSMSSSTKE